MKDLFKPSPEYVVRQLNIALAGKFNHPGFTMHVLYALEIKKIVTKMLDNGFEFTDNVVTKLAERDLEFAKNYSDNVEYNDILDLLDDVHQQWGGTF